MWLIEWQWWSQLRQFCLPGERHSGRCCPSVQPTSFSLSGTRCYKKARPKPGFSHFWSASDQG
jgi:hypothetical protein